MASGASFPELHHKMSKKIAQLTKVIYLLNTKSDENAYERECLVHSYEDQIREINADACRKIEEFRRKFEAANQNNNDMVSRRELEACKKMREEEKMTAMRQFELYKKKVSDNQAVLKKAAKDQIESLKREMEEVKTQFMMHMNSFTRITEGLDRNKESDAKRKQVELDEVVQKYNKKYNTMLAERMQIEDELTAQLQEAKRKADHSKEMDQKIKALKAQQKAELDAALSKQRQEYADMMRDKESDASKSVKKLLSDNIDKSKEIDRLSRENESFRQEIKDKDQRVLALEDELTEVKNAHDQSNSKSAKLDTQLASLNNKVDELKQEINTKNIQIQSLEQELHEAEIDKNTMENKYRTLLREMEAGDADKSSLSSENLALTTKLAELKAKASNNRKQMERSLQSKEAQINSLNKQIEELKDELSKSASSTKSLTSKEKKLKSKIKSLEESNSSYKAEIKRMKTELENLSLEIENLKNKLARNKDSESEIARQLDQARKAHRNALEQHEQEGQSLREAIQLKEKALAQMQSQYDSVLSQLTRIQAQSEETGASLANQLNTAKNAQNKLAHELSELNQAHQHQITIINDLKKQVSELSSHSDQLDSELRDKTQTISELESRIALLNDTIKRSRNDSEAMLGQELERERANARVKEKQLQQQFHQQIEELTNRHVQEKRHLEATHQQAINQLKSQLEQFEIHMKTLQDRQSEEQNKDNARIQDLINKHQQDLTEKDQQHRDHISRLEVDFQKKLDQLDSIKSDTQKEFAKKLKELELDLEREQQTTLEALRANHREELADLEAKHRQVLLNRRRMEDDNLEKQRSMWREQQNEQNEEKQAEWEASQTEWLNKEIKWQKKNKDLKKSLHTAENELGERDMKLIDLKAQLRAANSELLDARHNWEDSEERLKKTFAAKEQTLLDLHQDEYSALQRKLDQERDQLEAAKNSVISELESKLSEIEQAYRILNQKYNTRSSLPEDVHAIEELTQALAKARSDRKQAIEEMKYYKLELLNREENFNQIFSKQPRVGIMKVVNGQMHNNVNSTSNINNPNSTMGAPGGRRRGSVGAGVRMNVGTGALGVGGNGAKIMDDGLGVSYGLSSSSSSSSSSTMAASAASFQQMQMQMNSTSGRNSRNGRRNSAKRPSMR